jgi:hypothetical protein
MDVPGNFTGNDDGRNRRFIGLMSGIVGGGVVVVISGGVICLLVIIVAKKIRTRPNVGERRLVLKCLAVERYVPTEKVT